MLLIRGSILEVTGYHALSCKVYHSVLSTHTYNNEKEPNTKTNIPNLIKTHVHSSNYCSKGGRAEERKFPLAAPASRKQIFHDRTQLRLATHERIEIDIDFPVKGSNKPD